MSNIMRDRQIPLIELYKREPSAAQIVDVAATQYSDEDPLHSSVTLGPNNDTTIAVALHSAVGGDSDGPVPGDILAASLASCLDSALRVVADRLGVSIQHLLVTVRAEVDVRGTLLVDPAVPVGFQALHLHLELRLSPADEAKRTRLIKAAEQSCVVLQTLRNGVEVSLLDQTAKSTK